MSGSGDKSPHSQGVLVRKEEWFVELESVDSREQRETVWSLRKGS